MLLHESPYIASLVITAALALAAALYFSRRAPRGVVPFVAPVSYTHLRAHETVLDLVCRLLLETKKTCY